MALVASAYAHLPAVVITARPALVVTWRKDGRVFVTRAGIESKRGHSLKVRQQSSKLPMAGSSPPAPAYLPV